MRAALHAEWTKLRTVASPLPLLLGSVVSTVALGAVGGQVPIVILAVQIIGTEYGSGLIDTTLAATPQRTRVLMAKAVILTGVTAAAGAAAVLGTLPAGRLMLLSHDFTPANGGPAWSLADGPTLHAATETVLYLALIALLGLGIATAVRDSATGIGVVLSVLYVLPILAETIGNPGWHRVLQRVGPMTGGLGVTAGWAVAALVLAGAILHRR